MDNVDRFLEILQTFKGKVLSDAQIISDWLNGVNFGFMKLVLQPLLTHVQSAFTSEDSVEEELRSALQATVRKVPQEREEKAQARGSKLMLCSRFPRLPINPKDIIYIYYSVYIASPLSAPSHRSCGQHSTCHRPT